MERTVITIGRQFGSNGREIGRRLANRLNYQFYDKELLNEAAKASGMSTGILKSLDEKPNRSFLYNLVMDPYSYTFTSNGYQANLNQQAFQATYDTIKTLADKGPCVIVGRCADYALRHNPKLLSLFIHAPIEVRVKTVSERFGLTEDKARSQIMKEDKSRASYYNFYSTKRWGALDSYDMFINSSLVSIDDTVELICGCLQKLDQMEHQ